MRTLFVLLAVILLAQPAAARGQLDQGGGQPRDDAQKKARSVETEKAYQDTLGKDPGPERQGRSLGQGALSNHRRAKARVLSDGACLASGKGLKM